VCQVLEAIDAYRIRKVEALGLNAEQQVLVLLWDVHAVHILHGPIRNQDTKKTQQKPKAPEVAWSST
jgi:hypothetical protein